MVRDFKFSDLEISYLLGPAFIVSYVAMGIPAGWCADRYDRSRLILLAGIVWGIGTASATLATNYSALFMSRLIVGASEAFLYPASMSILPDLYSRQKLPLVTSIFLLAPPIGSAVALMGGGIILDYTDRLGEISVPVFGAIRGWQLTLGLIGIAGLIPVLLMATVRDNKRIKNQPNLQDPYGFLAGSVYIIRKWRFYLIFFAGMSSEYVAMATILSWSPTFLAREFGLSHVEIATGYGTVALICGLAGGIASPALSAFLSRFTPYPTMQAVRLGPIMLVIFACPLVVAESQTFVILCLGLLTFSFTFPMSMASTSLQLAAPDRLRGLASGYFFVIASLVGYGIGPIAVPLATSFIFNDPSRLGPAIAVISISFGAVGAILLTFALPAFAKECLRQSESSS